MELRSLEELREVEEVVRRLTPMGFSNVGMMSVEDTIEYQQETIAAADLVPAVPEQTRRSFERLRALHTYGALCYDLYTVASDQSLIVLELALAERFVEFYGGSVQLAKGQRVETIPCDTYQAVFDALQGHGRFPARDGWRLRLSTGGKQVRFNGYLSDLFEWARSEGLLRGQRNRRLEPLIVKMRNDVAHARGYRVTTPIDSARAIWHTAELINQLWGSPTTGGQRYPGPVSREVLAIGWNGDPPDNWTLLRASDQFEHARSELRDWTFLLVRGVENDEGLWNFHSRFEFTGFPTDYLYGPCSYLEALKWIKSSELERDRAVYLDRLFLVRIIADGVEWSRRPELFAALRGVDREGEWHLVQADFPGDAVMHVRGGPWGAAEPCAASGPCFNCAVEPLATGTWDEISAQLKHLAPGLVPLWPPEVRVPGRWLI
ncbi:MAG: hypothetical protein ABSA65_15950 [Acidimicrobiales bacterium]|jgi:hypothetical protein